MAALPCGAAIAQDGADPEQEEAEPVGPPPPAPPAADKERKPVELEAWFTHSLTGFVAGDASREWKLGGKTTLIADADLGRLGLWEGGSFRVAQEFVYGKDLLNEESGLLLPFGTIAFPRLGGKDHDTSFVLTQKIASKATLSIGKFNLLHSARAAPLVGGGTEETFLHTAIAGPVTGIITPYVGGAIMKVETKPVIATLMVFDPRNAQDWRVFSHPFETGVTGALNLTFPAKIGGLPGFYSVRGVASSSKGFDLTRIPDFAELPPGSEEFLQKKGKWYVNVQAQQFLHVDPTTPGAGWGVFGYLGASDANPNPLAWGFYAGLGGNTPGRPQDKWGLAYFKNGFSRDLLDGLNQLGINRRDESGIEGFYNYSPAPWLQLTGDLQWLKPFETEKKDAVILTIRARVHI
ncbi:carbohydrate porin [Altererythrobacter sp.]|uniref:carbohydrate porin n=1 Tax=Altererythrobacter sp. TaxID=1872480 RepID=UPI003D1413FA